VLHDFAPFLQFIVAQPEIISGIEPVKVSIGTSGKVNGETRTFPRFAFHADLPAMFFDNGLDDRQSQAIAFDIFDIIATNGRETLKINGKTLTAA
jgi:hypothetical protein